MSSTSPWARARNLAIAASGAAALATVAVGVMPAGAVAARPAAVSANFSCTTSLTGTTKYAFTVSIAATAPKTSLPGKPVSLKGVQMTVTVPQSLVQKAQSYGVTWIGGSTKLVDLNATDAKVKTVNIAAKTIKLPTVTLNGKAFTFKVPATAATVTWTAGTAKGTMTFTDGNATLNLTTSLGIGANVTCTPSPAKTIGTTAVS